jgi:hypothetical protein
MLNKQRLEPKLNKISIILCALAKAESEDSFLWFGLSRRFLYQLPLAQASGNLLSISFVALLIFLP